MIVVSFTGLECFPCKGRSVKKTVYEDVPVGMRTISARTWNEAKQKMLKEMEKRRPHKGILEVWNEKRFGV